MSQKRKNVSKRASALVFFALCAASAPAWGIRLLERRNEDFVLDLEGAAATPGDRYLVLDTENKRRALIEISSAEKGQAVARLTKGHLTRELSSYHVQALPARPAAAPPPTAKESRKNGRKSHEAAGLLVGAAQTSVKVALTGSSSVALTGAGAAFEGFYEKALSERWQILLRAGMQSLKAKGSLTSGSCTGSTNCELSVNYLGAEGLGKYMLSSAGYAPWLGGGVSLLYAASKSSNVVDVSQIGFMQKILVAAGARCPLGTKFFLPLQLEYAMFMNSSSVSAHQIFFRSGLGWNF